MHAARCLAHAGNNKLSNTRTAGAAIAFLSFMLFYDRLRPLYIMLFRYSLHTLGCTAAPHTSDLTIAIMLCARRWAEVMSQRDTARGKGELSATMMGWNSGV